MNTDTRSVLNRLRSSAAVKKSLCGVGVAALAATVIVATGFVRHLSAATGPDPIVSTMKPVGDNTIAPLLELDRATEAVAQRVIPAVVNISVVGESKSQAAMPGQMDPQQLPGPFRQFFFGQGPGGQFRMAPRAQPFMALGTGVIVSPNGYIVTNNHVVNGATHVTVTLHDKRQFPAKVVGTDKATDLAVIKIDATGLTSAAWGDSSQLQPGETVLAIGDPMGMDFSVTRGIVSATNRSRTFADGPNARGVFIQTDAPINHGNSGGPLVDVRGQVVGINSEMLSSSGASAGIGFAIASNVVKPTAEALIRYGKVTRGYLGIDVTDLQPSVADSLNEPNTEGALVNQVHSGSPAASAGIEPYDVVTGFNGHAVKSGSDLQTFAGAAAPGSTAKLRIMRNGKPMDVTITMGDLAKANSGAAAAETAAGGNSTPKLGMTVADLTPNLRSQLQLPDNVSGIVVESVAPGSPAMIAGISRGDVIEQVNRHPVSTVQALRRQVQMAPKGKDLLLLVRNGRGSFILPVNPQD